MDSIAVGHAAGSTAANLPGPARRRPDDRSIRPICRRRPGWFIGAGRTVAAGLAAVLGTRQRGARQPDPRGGASAWQWRYGKGTVNIKNAPGKAAGARAQDQGLNQLIQRGSLLPIIPVEALEELVLSGHDRIVASYAGHVGYPLPDVNELHKVAKYQSLTSGWKDRQLKQDYLDHVANHLLEVTKEGGTDAGRRRLDRAGARPVRGADPRQQCGVVPRST